MSSPYQVDRKLFAAVDRLGHAVRAARQRFATNHGLSLLQVKVIELLGEADARPLRVGSIAAELGVSSATVSDTVSSLDTKGAVRRIPDPADGRATLVQITASGQRLATDAAAALGPIMDATRLVPLADRGTALAVILDTIASLYRAGIISTEESCLTCDHFRPGTPDAYCELLSMDLPAIALRVRCIDHTPVPA